jgi:hypothetical protein
MYAISKVNNKFLNKIKVGLMDEIRNSASLHSPSFGKNHYQILLCGKGMYY